MARAKVTDAPTVPDDLAEYVCADWTTTVPGDDGHPLDCLRGWYDYLGAVDLWASANGLDADSPDFDFRFETRRCTT